MRPTIKNVMLVVKHPNGRANRADTRVVMCCADGEIARQMAQAEHAASPSHGVATYLMPINQRSMCEDGEPQMLWAYLPSPRGEAEPD